MQPYLQRLGLTSGQACTLALGLFLGVLLVVVSVPPVWNRAPAPRPRTLSPSNVGLTGAAPPTIPLVVAAPAPALLPPPAPTTFIPASFTPTRTRTPRPAPSAGPTAAGPRQQPPPTLPHGTVLRILEGGFSSTDPAPLVGAGVPANGLPVSAVNGSPREISFVRLVGTGATLRLRVASDRTATVGTASAQVCRLRTDRWQAGRPQAVVPHDPTACVPLVLAGDGTATADLSRFPDRSDNRGFALLPTGGTFRLTLIPEEPSS